MIKTLLDFANYVPYNVKLAHALGGAERAIILAVLINRHNYYESTGELDEEGFFYSTSDTMEENSAISGRAQDAAIKHLVEVGLVIKKLKGIPAKSHYKFPDDFDTKVGDILNSWKELRNKFAQIAEAKGRKMQRLKPANCGTNDNSISNNTEEENKIVASDTPSFESQNEQGQQSNSNLERKKESHPPVPLAPPPLKSKGKKDRASIAIPTSLNNADFLAEWQKLLQTKKWKGKEDSTLEGILEKLSTFDVRFATELANQARLNEWQGIIFAQTGKNYEMWLKSNAQSNNSPETVQLSVLANSGLKTLKIARKCKAYEIAESLVDKQTGFILIEAISQEDKAHIAWITKNITNHINNNTIDKQEWFCEFVTRKI